MGRDREMWESLVEKRIREAQERGEFDNLPGAGKPLEIRDETDPDWWVKGWVKRENIDLTDALPVGLQQRKEARSMPESLRRFGSEEAVRRHLEDFNARVLTERRRPVAGPNPPIWGPTVDVEEMVARWRELPDSRSDQQAG